MKSTVALGMSGLVLSAAIVGYNLQASEPAVADVAPTAQPALAEGAAVAVSDKAETEAGPQITVYKSPSCGCCADWAKHLETHGFAVDVQSVENMQAIKVEQGVPREMASCHTAVVDGLVVEGHVPAPDIKAYLEHRKNNFGDKTVGLAVPGMPHGSPGMETGRVDPYDVVAFSADGQSRIVNSYNKD